jgi:hypothetical protein
MCIVYGAKDEEEVGFRKVFVIQFQSPISGHMGHKIALGEATSGCQKSARGSQLQDVFGD